MLGRLITQLLVLVTTAILIGLIFKHLGLALYIGILFGIAIQFGIYHAFITILNAYIELRNKKLENERIKEFSLQGLEVTCPCTLKKREFVPIILNTNNAYKCDHCQKNVSVYISSETALVTETIASVTVPAPVPLIITDNGNS
jgi:hypothetical protein